MKISFDFDSTLSTQRIQSLAKKFINDGHDVWIVTSRSKHPKRIPNDNLYKTAKDLSIPLEKIIFTEYQSKHIFLEDFDIHFDDDQVEIEMIDEHLDRCVAILISNPIMYE